MKLIIIILIIVLVVICLVLKKVWGLYGNSNRMYEKTTGELNHVIETYDIWMRLTQDGYTISGYLKSIGINKVALCRMTEIGLRLYREFSGSGIEVSYLIDSDNIKLADIRYVSIEEECPEPVDIVIITDMFEYGVLRETLLKKGYENIDSPDGMLYAMLKKQAEDH